MMNGEWHFYRVQHGVRFCCNLCDTEFSSQQSLRKHWLAEHMGATYICLLCTVLFDNICILRRHKMAKHLAFKMVATCVKKYSWPRGEQLVSVTHASWHQWPIGTWGDTSLLNMRTGPTIVTHVLPSSVMLATSRNISWPNTRAAHITAQSVLTSWTM